MSTAMRKPFYLKPPWNILFEISKLEKLTPWNVNIAYLLTSFLSEMESTGKVDFRASGVALDSSALIYLMKSKLLLTLQEPPMPPKTPQDFVPPPLFLPLRYELTSTTIRNLLEVLDDVLKGEKLPHLDKVIAQPVLDGNRGADGETVCSSLRESQRRGNNRVFKAYKRNCSDRSDSHVYSASVSGAGWESEFVAE
jgi:hypothetical protein